jgi:hypothetical protein
MMIDVKYIIASLVRPLFGLLVYGTLAGVAARDTGNRPDISRIWNPPNTQSRSQMPDPMPYTTAGREAANNYIEKEDSLKTGDTPVITGNPSNSGMPALHLRTVRRPADGWRVWTTPGNDIDENRGE